MILKLRTYSDNLVWIRADKIEVTRHIDKKSFYVTTETFDGNSPNHSYLVGFDDDDANGYEMAFIMEEGKTIDIIRGSN